jgi:hypothetical protein
MAEPPKPKKIRVRGEDGKFRWVDAPLPELPAGAAPPASMSPAHRAALPHVSLSTEPLPALIDAVLERIARGEFHADAFVACGIAWSIAAQWLRLGEANVKLCAEDPARVVDWRGQLYRRVVEASAEAKSPIVVKVHKQAADEGGDLAIKWLKFRYGGGDGGAALGGRPAGRDYVEQEVTAGRDSMTDDEVLALIEGSIASARQAAGLEPQVDADDDDPLRRG